MLLFCMLLCVIGNGEPIFANRDSLIKRDISNEPAATETLLREFSHLPEIHPPAWKNLDSTWTFALGNPKEGLNAILDSLPKNIESITLPHRTLHADTPYWYVTDVDIPTPSVLEFDADDGAQLLPTANGFL